MAPFSPIVPFEGAPYVEPPYCNEAGQDEITRLREIEKELNDLKEGRTILFPISRDHAEKMVLVGEAFLKPQS